MIICPFLPPSLLHPFFLLLITLCFCFCNEFINRAKSNSLTGWESKPFCRVWCGPVPVRFTLQTSPPNNFTSTVTTTRIWQRYDQLLVLLFGSLFIVIDVHLLHLAGSVYDTFRHCFSSFFFFFLSAMLCQLILFTSGSVTSSCPSRCSASLSRVVSAVRHHTTSYFHC